ncbi:MAG: P-II family nitrogen regulator [Anaerolineales bacterium]|nr:P-II family nitrogen regulator [Anaerolineales bacterium]MCS7247630.1 P-II family nitrogen regulator [Anaerolineales bacterium]MDW8161440.1 P-II family nitrogen regulator [Anaerolineales bacterium]MDW8446571.1 P-II family nitrogen regulator [Anaerolineales bacterium]
MYYLVLLIVNNPEQVPKVLLRWEELGVTGITILESTGHGKLRRAGLLENFPLLVSIESLEEMQEIHHRTLLSVVDSEELVERMISTVQEAIGDLEREHSGLLFVLPVLRAIGICKD